MRAPANVESGWQNPSMQRIRELTVFYVLLGHLTSLDLLDRIKKTCCAGVTRNTSILFISKATYLRYGEQYNVTCLVAIETLIVPRIVPQPTHYCPIQLSPTQRWLCYTLRAAPEFAHVSVTVIGVRGTRTTRRWSKHVHRN